jgi:radical SAM superfamily enzyme YgiQ (UPF0313 family)
VTVKVLLISANPERIPNPVFPIGMSYVARALEPAHEVRLWDCIVDGEEGLPAAIRAFQPGLVGLSLRNVDTQRPDGRIFLGDYRRVTSLVRSATDAPLVLGGSAFTLFPQRYVAELGADFGIAGEGEHLRLLVDALAAGIAPDAADDGRGVPGLVRPGRAVTPLRKWAGPVGHAVASHRLFEAYEACGGMLNLQTKRGCTMHCCYCTYPVVEGRRLRRHDIETLVDEVERLREAGARYLFFVDSVFNLDVDHTTALAEALIRRNVKVPWAAYIAPYRVTPAYARLLREAGLTHAELGTESLSDPVLEAYGKPFRVRDVVAAHAALGEAGVHRAHFLLFGGPGETHATVEETLATSTTLPDSVFFPCMTMRIYPGTPLHRRAVTEGVVRADDSLFDPTFYCSPAVDPAWLQTRLAEEAGRRLNFVLNDTSEEMAALVRRAHARGRVVGPMWEFLCR